MLLFFLLRLSFSPCSRLHLNKLFFIDDSLSSNAEEKSDHFQVSSESKRPAWVDSADAQPTKISLLNGHSRLRKLRQTADEDEITGREYETRLRSQFERINPEPVWVRKARGVAKQNSGESEEEGIQDLLASTTGLLAEGRKRHGTQSVILRRETLAIERVRDANHSVQSSTSPEVRMLSFHPKPAVPVLCVGTADRRVRLFHVRQVF